MTSPLLTPDFRRLIAALDRRLGILERRRRIDVPVGAAPSTDPTAPSGGDGHDGVGASSVLIQHSGETDATADGLEGVAVGCETHADHDYATAVGPEARVEGTMGTAVGFFSKADYDSADEFVSKGTAVGGSSFSASRGAALGYDAGAGTESVAVGYMASAGGGGGSDTPGLNVAVGAGANAEHGNIGATAVGGAAHVYDDSTGGTAVGHESLALGDDSTSLGHGASGNGEGSLALGAGAIAGGNGVALGAAVIAGVSQVMLGSAGTYLASAGDDGLVIKSPDTTLWRITVTNAGVLSVALA